jgi:hypothetical protein
MLLSPRWFSSMNLDDWGMVVSVVMIHQDHTFVINNTGAENSYAIHLHVGQVIGVTLIIPHRST